MQKMTKVLAGLKTKENKKKVERTEKVEMEKGIEKSFTFVNTNDAPRD